MKNLTSLVAFLFGLTVLTFIVSCDHHPKKSETSNFVSKYFPRYEEPSQATPAPDGATN